MSGDLGRVLAEAGEPAPGPRPPGWDDEARLSRMREDAAAFAAARAVRWAVHAAQRRAARELYEQTRARAGLPPAGVPAWLADEAPPWRLL
jgi:hypothetical protein